MVHQRVLAIGLDGFEISLAERLMSEGRMPNMAALRARSACYKLDHGPAKYTGLAWEHVSTGRTPEALDRYSAVSFNPSTYHVSQEPTHAPPLFGAIDARCVLFDVPYCDLHLAPNQMGVARWGAHDPGAPESCNPPTLTAEMTERFGPYPATEHIYAMVWHSEEQTRRAGEALTEAVRVRARAAEWMLRDRLPDWDLAVVVVSEPHSAIEPLWHGVDPKHPLHVLPSAKPARECLEAIYVETDKLIGMLRDAAPDAAIVLFAMHGMGSNGADVAAMALLPELLYRRQFGKAWMRDLRWAKTMPGPNGTSLPLLAEEQAWHFVMEDRIPPLWSDAVKQALAERPHAIDAPIINEEIDWQPASRYRPFWPQMEAFAVPSFYDGRVRLNLIGREKHGMVSPNRRHQLLGELTELLHECRDSVTGAGVIADVVENTKPFEEIGPTESDLYIYWNGLVTGLDHPKLGRIGPLPVRRTGGHSGRWGFLYCAGGDLPVGDHGVRSSFDVVPTLLDMLGTPAKQPVSGVSFLA